MTTKPKWFVRGDLDGFFGLFVDNLLQLMLIRVLCEKICGLPAEFITHRILPAAAFSIFGGNAFYSWQAHRLASRSGHGQATALPFGINTPSLVAFIFLIMGPVYHDTHDANLAWQAGLFACLLNGVMETAGAFVADPLRRHTPRAALLSALAGIALTFIAMGFVFQIFASPLVAVVPMLLILAHYASGVKLPLGLPGGFASVMIGLGIAWLLQLTGVVHLNISSEPFVFGFHPPQPAGANVFALLTSPTGWKYFSIILPMGLFNVIGSLQNLESAEAAGDRYETRPSLLANGIGTLLAAFLGSPFPTTIYIGHPGWKAMGARIGYSILNGTVIAVLCLFGGVTLVLRVVPVEVTLGILLWIAIIITAQAFQESPKRHALAVALGLVPSLAAWALLLVETTLRVAGSSLFDAAPKFGEDLFIHGVIALNQGFIIQTTLFSALLAFLIDRQFLKGGVVCLIAAVCSCLGLIHAYVLTPGGVENKFGWMSAPGFAAAYVLTALFLVFLGCAQGNQPEPAETEAESDLVLEGK